VLSLLFQLDALLFLSVQSRRSTPLSQCPHSSFSLTHFQTYLLLNNRQSNPQVPMPSLEKNPDFFARFESVWCWTCGKVTTHEITWRWGGRCYMCKGCAKIVVEKLR